MKTLCKELAHFFTNFIFKIWVLKYSCTHNRSPSWALSQVIAYMFISVPKKTSKSRDLKTLRACLHVGWGPQVGEVTRLGGVTCLSI